MKETIFTVSASDRNNYGDLLFPLVLEKAAIHFGYSFDFTHAATIANDLTDFGAHPTISHGGFIKSLHALQQSKMSHRVIFAGGEALGSSWFNLIRFLNPYAEWAYRNPIMRRLIRRSHVFLRVYSYLYETPYPFILGVDDSKKAVFSYNSIGAGSVAQALRSDPNVSGILKRAQWLSVRDLKSQKLLKSWDIHSELVPDSALLMRELFSEEILEAKRSDHKRPKRYIVVQFNRAKGPTDYRAFAQSIENIAAQLDADVLLLPIGLARGHDDLSALKSFQSYLPSSLLYSPTDVFDIMRTIAAAELFIGSSLHGVITAQSFERPFIGLSQYIHKLHYYLQTWNKESLSCFDYQDFDACFEAALQFSYSEVEEKGMKDLVWNSLEMQFAST